MVALKNRRKVCPYKKCPSLSISIYTTFSHNKNNELKTIKLPLLLERVGVRRIKSISYIPPHPNLLPQGRRSWYLCRYQCSLSG
jgi:hypothetical protein